jgi:hypothetical protein
MDRIKRYAEVVALAGSLASGLWFGVVQPRFKALVKNEISFQNYLLMEIATDDQIDRATRKWKAGKE